MIVVNPDWPYRNFPCLTVSPFPCENSEIASNRHHGDERILPPECEGVACLGIQGTKIGQKVIPLFFLQRPFKSHHGRA